MRWQDIVISIAQFCFVIAIVPSIRGKDKPAAATSVANVLLITVIVVSFLTLRFWYSAFTAGIVGVAWLILAVQKIKLNKRLKKAH